MAEPITNTFTLETDLELNSEPVQNPLITQLNSSQILFDPVERDTSRQPIPTVPVGTTDDGPSPAKLKKVNYEEDLRILLECPVCKEVPFKPILNCSRGHGVCQSCRIRLPKCPLCQGEFTESRNFMMEAMITALSHPCPYKSSGCLVIESGDKMKHHLETCPHGFIYSCLLKGKDGCTKNGLLISDVKTHMIATHKADLYTKASYGFILNVNEKQILPAVGGNYELNLPYFFRPDIIEFDGNIFIGIPYTKKRVVYYTMVCLGNETLARKHIAKIKFSQEGNLMCAISAKLAKRILYPCKITNPGFFGPYGSNMSNDGHCRNYLCSSSETGFQVIFVEWHKSQILVNQIASLPSIEYRVSIHPFTIGSFCDNGQRLDQKYMAKCTFDDLKIYGKRNANNGSYFFSVDIVIEISP